MNAPANITTSASAVTAAEARLSKYDWTAVGNEINQFGSVPIRKLLSPAECKHVTALYPEEKHFRSRVPMARHGFGKGEYQYFHYPIPDLIGGLRTALYPKLATVANAWNERMNISLRYPERHAQFLKQCHDAGQTRPTPLLLQYVRGDFNCLHQDLYGELAFPIPLRAGEGLHGR
jgi:hypothetical protein